MFNLEILLLMIQVDTSCLLFYFFLYNYLIIHNWFLIL